MYATGTFAIDATDPRNQFNERALYEARMTTEYRIATGSSNDAAAEPHARGLFDRVRAAVTGTQIGTTPEPCPCPA